METTSQPMEKSKKPISLKSFLDSKKIDTKKLREYFLENFSNIPQELRLILWKIVLGISSPFHQQSSDVDKLLKENFSYLNHIIQKVLEIKTQDDQILNYYIYLLDKDSLPICNFEECLREGTSFMLIYKQLNEILDDQSEYETYYIAVEIYENLKKNIKKLTEKFESCLSSETLNRQLIDQLNIEPFLECGLAGFFKDLKMYHIIWDRVAMGEYEMLVCVLLSFLESCKEEQLKCMKTLQNTEFNSIKSKFSLDESKILKRTTKYYRNFHTNPLLCDLIVKYFNLKQDKTDASEGKTLYDINPSNVPNMITTSAPQDLTSDLIGSFVQNFSNEILNLVNNDQNSIAHAKKTHSSKSIITRH
ncbi:unnamed protein product [Brachionus calyciflorus]|uniref:TBC1 domain family member 7 n=1 Tax=Brachionus calyciflorus TaxID=104777 RepID=A0A813XVW3_9BILA|nr:unnamed protein product [Brachionus calyciflorus]